MSKQEIREPRPETVAKVQRRVLCCGNCHNDAMCTALLTNVEAQSDDMLRGWCKSNVARTEDVAVAARTTSSTSRAGRDNLKGDCTSRQIV